MNANVGKPRVLTKKPCQPAKRKQHLPDKPRHGQFANEILDAIPLSQARQGIKDCSSNQAIPKIRVSCRNRVLETLQAAFWLISVDDIEIRLVGELFTKLIQPSRLKIAATWR